MPSPVLPSDFPDLSQTSPLCQRLGALLAGYDAMKEFVDWLLDDEGEISDEVVAGFSDRLMPIGAIIPWGSTVMPSDSWLPCRGQSVSRTTLDKLFVRIGTTFGADPAAPDTFRLPNIEERFILGTGVTHPMGVMGGESTVKLTLGQMPKHTHDLTGDVYDQGAAEGDDGGGSALNPLGTKTLSAGNDEAHENMPPFLALMYIMKVK